MYCCSKIFSPVPLKPSPDEIWCHNSIKFDRLRPFLVLHRLFEVFFHLFRRDRVRRGSIEFESHHSSQASRAGLHSDFSTLVELDYVLSVKVPRAYGAEDPGKPLAAAYNSLKTTLSPHLRRRLLFIAVSADPFKMIFRIVKDQLSSSGSDFRKSRRAVDVNLRTLGSDSHFFTKTPMLTTS